MTKFSTPYTKPAMVRHGSIEEMTMASGGVSAIDADFPAGTLFGDLTFS